MRLRWCAATRPPDCRPAAGSTASLESATCCRRYPSAQSPRRRSRPAHTSFVPARGPSPYAKLDRRVVELYTVTSNPASHHRCRAGRVRKAAVEEIGAISAVRQRNEDNQKREIIRKRGLASLIALRPGCRVGRCTQHQEKRKRAIHEAQCSWCRRCPHVEVRRLTIRERKKTPRALPHPRTQIRYTDSPPHLESARRQASPHGIGALSSLRRLSSYTGSL